MQAVQQGFLQSNGRTITAQQNYVSEFRFRHKIKLPDEKKLYEIVYTHPKYTQSSISTQEKIKEVNGSNHLYFCGSYCRYGFHEDGVISAVDIAKELGCKL